MDPIFLGSLAVWRHACSGLPRARCLLIHGISEHSARHLPTVQALNKASIEVVRFDLRGAGESKGTRQYVKHFQEYVDDTTQVLNWIQRDLEPLPLFVLGHSMGGAVAIHFASQQQNSIQGLVLSAPGFIVGGAISPVKIFLGRMIASLLPKLRLHSEDSTSLSRDPAVIEAYKRDPLASRFNTLSQGRAVLDAFQQIPDLCKKIRTPTIILHGTADRVIAPAGSFDILRALGARDKELHYLPGVYHEPHLDWESGKFFALLTLWLNHQITKSPTLKPSKPLKNQLVTQANPS